MPATIQSRIFVFEITVSGYTEVLPCLLGHKRTHTLSTTGTFISVYCLLHVLAFVGNHRNGIKKYIMIFSIQPCRMVICFSQRREHATSKKTDISVVVIDHHISQWDVIPKDTVPVVYRWETWLIIFSDEHGLRMFENRVLRMMSGLRGSIRKLKRTAY